MYLTRTILYMPVRVISQQITATRERVRDNNSDLVGVGFKPAPTTSDNTMSYCIA